MKPILLTFITLIYTIGFSQIVPPFVSDVYNNIFTSMDNGHTIKPKLLIDLNPSQIVTFNPTNNELKIGSEFIFVCRKFGKDSSNAIAHVLGHELAHILLQQHDFVRSVGSGYASKEINKQMKSIHKILKDSVFERQADEYASLYAHIAGYNTAQIGERLLDSIYMHFKLKDKDLSQYPSLKERKLIYRASAAKMNALRSIFDYANLATVAGNYDMAESCYQTIIKEKFPSREIFNNLSVVYILKAIQEIDTLEFPYLLPIELDFESRLYSSERSIFSKYEENLLEAKRYAKLALGTKEDYAKAWLNKGIADFLLNKKEDADYSLFKAKSLHDSYVKASVEVMEAIMEHKFGEKENGIEKLGYLKSNNINASFNYFKLMGEKNLVINNIDSIIYYLEKFEKPVFNFQSTEVKKSEINDQTFVSVKSLHLIKIANDRFSGYEIKDAVSKTKFIFYKVNEPFNKQLIENSNLQNDFLYSPSNNHHFIKIKNWIFEIDNGQIIQCYLIDTF